MRTLPPSRLISTSHSQAIKRIRIARLLVLFVCLVIGVTALASTSSSASSLGQLFNRAMAIFGGSQKTTTNIKVARVSASLNSAVPEPQSPSTTMTVERRGHTATRLSDGRVLIAGGENSSGALNQSEIYDPATATFSATGNMNAARADHTATLLADGRVLITGGRNGAGSLTTTEIFDPTTGAFASGPAMSVARAGHSATLFANGHILIAGGDANGSAEIFDPSSSTFSAVGATMNAARSMHSAALLNAGNVLIVGGTAPDGKVQIIGGTDHEDMEVYDPAINSFGAHAHVFPIGDSHPELLQQIMDAQTRAAMFRLGASSALLNRTGQTITELSGSTQALVAGGVDSTGAFLNSVATLNSSAATITTDKLDYAPGTPVLVSGTGWQPNEVVTIMFHEDPHVATENPHTFTVQADANGNFVNQQYAPEDQDAGLTYILAATGGSSSRTAQTALTDASISGFSITFPANNGNYNNTNYNAGCTTVGICGAVNFTNGSSSRSITVSLKRNSDNADWNGSSFVAGTSGSRILNAGSIDGSGNGSIPWHYAFAVPPDGAYTVRAHASDSGDTTGSDAGPNIFTVDNTGPTLNSVTGPANGTYGTGQQLNFTVNYNENVTVTGTPFIPLTIGATSRNASYLSGSGSSALVFRHTVQAGDTDTDFADWAGEAGDHADNHGDLQRGHGHLAGAAVHYQWRQHHGGNQHDQSGQHALHGHPHRWLWQRSGQRDAEHGDRPGGERRHHDHQWRQFHGGQHSADRYDQCTIAFDNRVWTGDVHRDLCGRELQYQHADDRQHYVEQDQHR